MGTQRRKKKTTKNTNSAFNEWKRDSDLAANKAAIQPTFEGTALTIPMINIIDFVSVTDSVDPSQG